ncbi:hypothetical protein EP331_14270 [bacterium]|nr:MAG: hypothetical protein EP331_14270 [bacterium]
MNYLEKLTPCFLFDGNQTRANAIKMLEYAHRQKVRLRPHVKTHKSVEIASFQCDTSKSITVSTIAELLYFYDKGFINQTYAVPITSEKLQFILDKISITHINFITDNVNHLDELIRVGEKNQTSINLFIKVDVGADRAGLQADSSDVLVLAKIMAESTVVNFKGLLTHAGQSYHSSELNEKKEIALKEVNTIVQLAEKLEKQGIQVKERSIGSTPTMSLGVDLNGITEIRPGNYIWYDVFQYQRGNCEIEEIACSVLTSVIGVYPERGVILVDAGALALSKDEGFWSDGVRRYGLIKNHPTLQLIGISQEHGKIKATQAECMQFKVGDKLEVLPNHSCLTAACFHSYYEVLGGEVIQEINPAKFW